MKCLLVEKLREGGKKCARCLNSASNWQLKFIGNRLAIKRNNLFVGKRDSSEAREGFNVEQMLEIVQLTSIILQAICEVVNSLPYATFLATVERKFKFRR